MQYISCKYVLTEPESMDNETVSAELVISYLTKPLSNVKFILKKKK